MEADHRPPGTPSVPERHHAALPEHARVVPRGISSDCMLGSSECTFARRRLSAAPLQDPDTFAQTEPLKLSQKTHKERSAKGQPPRHHITQRRPQKDVHADAASAQPPLKKTRTSWVQGDLLPSVCLASLSKWKTGKEVLENYFLRRDLRATFACKGSAQTYFRFDGLCRDTLSCPSAFQGPGLF